MSRADKTRQETNRQATIQQQTFIAILYVGDAIMRLADAVESVDSQLQEIDRHIEHG